MHHLSIFGFLPKNATKKNAYPLISRLLTPFCLLLGNIVRHLCIEFKIPFPYTVILLLLGLVLGLLENNVELGLLGRSIDSIKHMSPHLLFSI